jgi:hypothetical protein
MSNGRPHRDEIPEARLRIRISRRNEDWRGIVEGERFYAIPEIRIIYSDFGHLLEYHNLNDFENAECYATLCSEFALEALATVPVTEYSHQRGRAYFEFANLPTPAPGRYQLRFDVTARTPARAHLYPDDQERIAPLTDSVYFYIEEAPPADWEFSIRGPNGNNVAMEEDQTFSSIPNMAIMIRRYGSQLEYHRLENLDTTFCNAFLIDDLGHEVPWGREPKTEDTDDGLGSIYDLPELRTPAPGRYRLRFTITVLVINQNDGTATNATLGQVISPRFYIVPEPQPALNGINGHTNGFDANGAATYSHYIYY